MKLGPYAIERDFSHYVVNAAEIVLAVVGTATKGPINKPTVCTSIQDLVNKFGNLSPNCLGLYGAQYFLQTASKLYFVRAATSAAKASTVMISGKTAGDVSVSDALVLEAQTTGTAYDGYSVVVEVVAGTGAFNMTIKSKAGNTLESFKYLSLSGLGTTVDGAVIVNPDVIKSKYVTVKSISATAESLLGGTYVFSGGNDGISGITSAEYITASKTLSDTNLDCNLIAIPGVSDAAVIQDMFVTAETRGDCLYLVDPPNGLDKDEIADWHNGEGTYDDHAKFNSDYAALYWGWQKIYDPVNKLYVEVPPSVVVAPVFAKSTQMSEIWYAPAGLNRGLISGVIDSVVTPDSPTVECLYSDNNSINCIINDPQVGLCVFGQKTLHRLNTALDRVNVRMLMNYLKRVIVAACRTLTFEPNDRITWNAFHDKVEPLLKRVKTHRGLYEYKIVRGEAIVTPEDIDNYRMPCMILIRPTKTAEEIPIYFAITSTGADFNDVLEAQGIVNSD